MNHHVLLHLILGCSIGLAIFTQNKSTHDASTGQKPPINCELNTALHTSQQEYQVLVARAMQPPLHNKSHNISVVIDVEKPTVLILAGSQKNHWTINEIQHGKVIAIFATGTADQTISSNDPFTLLVPYIKSYIASHCIGKDVINTSDTKLQEYASYNFNRLIQGFFEGKNALLVTDHQKKEVNQTSKETSSIQLPTRTTAPQETSSIVEINDPRYIKLPKAKEGIQKALELGLIKPATSSDSRRFDYAQSNTANHHNARTYTSSSGEDFKHQFHSHKSYVILKPFIFPEDMHGAHSATFYLERHVPYPKGDLSHSTLYNINDGTCRGSVCRMHQ